MQAFTFYATEDKLVNRGNKAGETIGVDKINRYISQFNCSSFLLLKTSIF